MLTRTLLGVAAGGVGGLAGYLSCWWVIPEECLEVGGRTCGTWFIAALLILPACWAVVASLVLFWALKLLKLPRAWPASGLGCAFWPLVWFAGGYVCWTHGVLVVIVVPVVAYALAGALTGFKLSSS